MEAAAKLETTISVHVRAHAGDDKSLLAHEYILAKQLALVRRLINRSASINRLPDEILGVVFTHLDDETMFAVTGTCARFRSAALFVWRTLPTPSIHLTKCCLERTGGLPVRLRIRDEGVSVTPEHVAVLLQKAPGRISTIDVALYGNFCAGAWLLEKLGEVYLPKLDFLCVRYGAFTSSSVVSTPSPMLPLQRALEKRMFQYLTHLELINCGHMRLVLPMSLQYLELHNAFVVMSMGNFLGLVAALDKLDVLVVGLDPSPWDRRFPRVEVDPLPAHRIALPSLRRLRVRGSWDLTTAILQGSVLGSACSIEIETLTSEYLDDPSVTRALSALLQNYESSVHGHFAEVVVSRHMLSSSSHYSIEDLQLLVESDGASQPQITLAVSGLRALEPVNEAGWRGTEMSPFYSRLLQFNSLAQIPRMCINGSLCDEPTRAIPPFPSIRELAFRVRQHEGSWVPELRFACNLFGRYPDLHVVEWIDLAVPEENEQTREDFAAMIDALIALSKPLKLHFVRCTLSATVRELVHTLTAHSEVSASVL